MAGNQVKYGPNGPGNQAPGTFLVLLVNDSEYSQSTGAKPIFRSLLAVFISFPLVGAAGRMIIIDK